MSLRPQIARAGLILNRPLYVGLNNGLVGYWSFDGPDMAGNVAYDRSGNGNNATRCSASIPAQVAGRIGQGLEFNDTNCGAAQLNAGSNASIDNAITYSVWVYPKTGGGTEGIFEKCPLTCVTERKRLWIAAASQTFFLSYTGTLDCSIDAGTVDFNTWQHVVYITDRNTGECSIYKNGNLVSTVTGTNLHDDSAGTLTMGSDEGGDGVVNGKLDEMRIYNRRISDAEIKRLYKIGATLLVNKPSYVGLNNGLVGYWSFNGPDMAGTDPITAYDRSGNGNNATSSGSDLVRRIAGRIGQGISARGTNGGYMDAGSDASLDNVNSTQTYSVWVYTRSLGEQEGGGIASRRLQNS